MSSTLRIIALTPPGFASPAMARAVGGYAKGLCGGASLEHCGEAEACRVVATLSGQGQPFAVAIGEMSDGLLSVLGAAAGRDLTLVMLCDPNAERLGADIGALHKAGVEVLVEVTSLEAAELTGRSGADGLVVKGNEAGGRVGEETTFILLQRVKGRVDLPVYARGGIGPFAAAACQAAGAAGVVLDWQLALCAESVLPEGVRTRLARMDGSETAILGQDGPVRFRAYARPGEAAFAQLKALEKTQGLGGDSDGEVPAAWQDTVYGHVNADDESNRLLLIGQDAAFAAPLAAAHGGAVDICRAIQREARRLCQVAAHHQALRPNGPLAKSHGTRYPIVQGPMTRVSDRAEFAKAVADGGGLPFLALALLRGPDVAKLLAETKALLGNRPWGVGILGFVPKELRQEQLAEVSKCQPSFAIIAGGRPDQAQTLEAEGIATYLHVPSPGLLEMFLKQGARRLIFEGRECGGHVGPRSSFVLWESMIGVILDHLAESGDCGSDYQVLFAGGIHDGLSAAMVAAMAGPLSERGVQIGVLMGTAYLFTREAVSSGAIVSGFQERAIGCSETMLLETGVGHATRCAKTAFGQQFLEEKRRLISAGASKEDVRNSLEVLNLGRLRVASKGVTRNGDRAASNGGSKLVAVDEAGQLREGMYMIGQVAALREDVCGIEQLHEQVSAGGVEHLEAVVGPQRRVQPSASCDVAIVGMSCMLPKAPDVERYWHNILTGVNGITEVPKSSWDAELYFDGDRQTRDKVYSKWGGFIEAVAFDPMRYGMPPNSLPSIEPLQLLTLEVVRRALQDAGYEDRPFDRENTCVVLGAGGGVGTVGMGYGFRSMLPHYMAKAGRPDLAASELIDELEGQLPEWTEDSFAGLLLNVAAGRVANRFDFGGANYVVDAACASSLAAVRLGCNELRSGAANLAIVGGVDTMQSPFAYLCFAKTQALSPRGISSPFDEAGDGIVISEGLAMVVLKRVEDAERDGDRIYAVIKSVGSSSDGKDKGLTAPRPAGQVRALERAYRLAGVSPDTVGLVEAHGTGTVVGDQSEVESLRRTFEAAGARRQSCAVGSVKSMIGHTKCTAGVAGLIKAALALHHKVLPPTLNVTAPNPKANFEESPFYVNTEARPWLQGEAEVPRRAGVSAFGFGGTNFHAVLEEHTSDQANAEPVPGRRVWPSELFVWCCDDADQLIRATGALRSALNAGAEPALSELAQAVCSANTGQNGCCRLAIVAESVDDLAAKLGAVKSAVADGQHEINDPRGIYYFAQAKAVDGTLAAVFPGQGSQSVNMLRDLALAFPCVREVFERTDRALGDTLGKPLSEYIFVRPAFTDAERAENQKALTDTQVAQPAMGAADLAAFALLSRLGIRPSFGCGHSYGEYAALGAAGVLSVEDLMRVSQARGRTIAEAARTRPGTMAAVRADAETVGRALEGLDDVWVANYNSPVQTVITGTEQGVEAALKTLSAAGVAGRRIQVSCAFHSPLVAAAQGPFGQFLDGVAFGSARFAVYSNTTTQRHSDDATALKSTLVDHLAKPVRFAEQLEAMHDAGARVFVEMGPGKTLTGLVEQTLKGRDFVALAIDQPGRDGLVSLLHAVGRLASMGVDLDTRVLFEGRTRRRLDLERLVEQTKPEPVSPTTWMVSGSQAIPPSGFLRTVKPVQAARVEKPVTPVVSDIQALQPKTPPAPTHGPMGNGQLDSVMAAHHQLMTRFLESHKKVMLGFLQGGGERADSVALPSEVERPGPQPVIEAAPPNADRLASVRADDPQAPSGQTPEPTGETGFSRERLIERLLGVVSERTGYPADMLDLDQDLEADLGIDSIKRIEILGSLQSDSLLPAGAVDADMEVLAKLGTLRAIVDWIEARAGTAGDGGEEQRQAEAENVAVQADADEQPQPRMLLEMVGAPLPNTVSKLKVGGVVIITDDGAGIARGLADRLEGAGCVCVVVDVDEVGEGAAGLVAELQEKHGRIGAVIHLHPLGARASGQTLDVDGWRRALDVELNSLFGLIQAAESNLRQGDGGVVLAAMRMGGGFGSVDIDATSQAWPGHGGICGLVKSTAREWDNVRCKVVDFDEGASEDFIADALLTEIGTDDRRTEIGYRQGVRESLQPVPTPMIDRDVGLALNSESVVLVTGGARGITADVALELAERFACKLVLVGRSPLPPADESPDTASLSDARELKAAIRSRIEREGQRATPAEIEIQYKRLCGERETRVNLAAMQQAGSTVDYRSVDVTDAAAFGSLIEDIYNQYGRIDGAIHGAGLIEDKLIRDKTPESFGRVMDPKVTGALVLADRLRHEALQFLVFFSSVSGRYGNRGQCDYAAANEVLNKLAVWLNARWPGRVTSLNWGPWESAGGMVSAELAKQFGKAGIRLIGRAEGRKLFIDELLYGNKREAEVVLGGPLQAGPMGGDVDSGAMEGGAGRGPLLTDKGATVFQSNGSIEVTRRLDPAQDRYLLDHQLDGAPVLPMAMMLELFAEVACSIRPGLELVGIKDVCMLGGITLNGGDYPVVRVTGTVSDEVDGGVDVTLRADCSDDGRTRYTAKAMLRSVMPASNGYSGLQLKSPRSLSLSVSQAYDQWLFHGPIFAGIKEVHAVGDDGIIGQVSSSSPGGCLTEALGDSWLIDPVVVDCGLQLLILWARTHLDATPLPSRLGRYHRYGELVGDLRCEVRIVSVDGPRLRSDIRFLDAGGRLVGWLEDMEVTCSKALNRLAGATAGGQGAGR